MGLSEKRITRMSASSKQLVFMAFCRKLNVMHDGFNFHGRNTRPEG